MERARPYFEEHAKFMAPLGMLRYSEEHVKAVAARQAQSPTAATLENGVRNRSWLCGPPDDIVAYLKEVEQRYPGLEHVMIAWALGTPRELMIEQLTRFARRSCRPFVGSPTAPLSDRRKQRMRRMRSGVLCLLITFTLALAVGMSGPAAAQQAETGGRAEVRPRRDHLAPVVRPRRGDRLHHPVLVPLRHERRPGEEHAGEEQRPLADLVRTVSLTRRSTTSSCGQGSSSTTATPSPPRTCASASTGTRATRSSRRRCATSRFAGPTAARFPLTSRCPISWPIYGTLVSARGGSQIAFDACASPGPATTSGPAVGLQRVAASRRSCPSTPTRGRRPTRRCASRSNGAANPRVHGPYLAGPA